MLVLSRREEETIVIGDDVRVTLVEIRGDKVRLGVEAPEHVPVHRLEVYESLKAERSGFRGSATDHGPRTADDAQLLLDELSEHRPVHLELDPLVLLALIGNLQLALRHPGNRGDSAQLVRNLVDQAIDTLEVSADAKELLRRGDNPAYDVPSLATH